MQILENIVIFKYSVCIKAYGTYFYMDVLHKWYVCLYTSVHMLLCITQHDLLYFTKFMVNTYT